MSDQGGKGSGAAGQGFERPMKSQAGQILAKGHEAYRRAGAEPSEQPAPAQVVSLKV